MNAFPTEADCIAHLEKLRWNGIVESPFDASSKVYKCAGNRYKCKNTGKYFNVKVGTIFEDTKIPLIKWFMALYIFSSHKKGISSHQLAKDIDVTQKTAWFILHRLRYAFEHPAFQEAIGETVEVDETYMGGEEENKHESKRNKNARGRGLGAKKPVVGMLQRDGSVIAKVTDDTKLSSVQPIIDRFVKKGSVVVTDEWVAYNQVNRNFDHLKVAHSAKEFVNGMARTNGIENFWSHLKRGIDGIYHWCSVKHLQAYLDEFALRFNTRKMGTAQRFNFVLENVSGRLSYKVLING
ncbi:IS1595 family transposase [Rufibacter sp. DG15C]|uniref:IS1595 family transposase n=1 Tax=Rufibacter sp. DG15C TaxID=1379909 RepID=UPI001E3FC5F2|nr:IS1595 family transposase [Rufibacter sp. DG15C]